MKKIPFEVGEAFKKIKEKQQGYVELKYSKGSWCVRKSTCVWDKIRKKPRKISEHLGVISVDGVFKQKVPRNAIRETGREVFEFGNAALAYYLLKDVELILKDLTVYYQEIVAYAVIKVIDSKPIRLLSSRWEKFYLSQQISVGLSPKHMSAVLYNIGVKVSFWYELFSKLITDMDIVIYDLSRVFTYSENIKTAEKGYNCKHLYLDQIVIALAFSSVNTLPIGVEIFPGSMKETEVIRDFRKRLPQKVNIGYVFDRGFTDYTLLEELRLDNTRYIIPLKKDSIYMDYQGVQWRKPFVYRNKHILWGRKKSDLGYIYFYDDPEVRGEQETALLKKVEKRKITLAEFQEKRKNAGIIGIISDMDKKGYDIYDTYKGKEDIELAFDALNNHVDSDKTYLRTEESIRGYYFISFISLIIYFKILKRLREKKLTNKISVEEVLYELSKVIKIKEKNNREYYAKVPKKARKIMELFPEVFNATHKKNKKN